jgi:[ribosomal protein S5]-alanine N-acetyltransferase
MDQPPALLPNIQLLVIDPQVAQALQDPAAFEATFDVRIHGLASLVEEMAQANEALRLRSGSPVGWGGFLAVDTSTRAVVGTCGFKGKPEDGAVEIAYFTFPPYERRGYAGAMARAVVARAREAGVPRILAHTLPQPNASTRVLQKIGFAHLGSVQDPEDGEVWRWELRG